MNSRVYFAGGGTAGHLMPAIAVANSLVEMGANSHDLLFIGASRGVESRLVPENGFKVATYPGRGIKRSVSPSAIAWNVVAIAELVGAFALVFSLFVRKRPGKVVVVGGYGAAPSALGAFILRIPLYVIHVDSVAGLVNRWSSKFARASFVPDKSINVPHKYVTGVPIRKNIEVLDRNPEAGAQARKLLNIDNSKFVVYIFGGSLGARSINKAVDELIDMWSDCSDVCVRHVVGIRRAEESAVEIAKGAIQVQKIDFDSDIAFSYLACDVAVARSGAITVAELAAACVPSVLVPLPGSPGDHQTLNAQRLVDIGGAILIEDKSLDGKSLASALLELKEEPSRRASMEDALRSVRQIGAAEEIAKNLIP